MLCHETLKIKQRVTESEYFLKVSADFENTNNLLFSVLLLRVHVNTVSVFSRIWTEYGDLRSMSKSFIFQMTT